MVTASSGVMVSSKRHGHAHPGCRCVSGQTLKTLPACRHLHDIEQVRRMLNWGVFNAALAYHIEPRDKIIRHDPLFQCRLKDSQDIIASRASTPSETCRRRRVRRRVNSEVLGRAISDASHGRYGWVHVRQAMNRSTRDDISTGGEYDGPAVDHQLGQRKMAT